MGFTNDEEANKLVREPHREVGTCRLHHAKVIASIHGSGLLVPGQR